MLAADLVNSRAASMCGVAVLETLPPSWNLATVLPALKQWSRGLLHHRRTAALTRGLHRAENTELRVKLAEATRPAVPLLASHYCAVCQKPFEAGAGLARYPNGVTLHPACVTDSQICPVTGQIFTVTAE